MSDLQEEPWECTCGETDITKHDLGMVLAHEFGMSMQDGRDTLVRIRARLGYDTPDEDKIFPKEET